MREYFSFVPFIKSLKAHNKTSLQENANKAEDKLDKIEYKTEWIYSIVLLLILPVNLLFILLATLQLSTPVTEFLVILINSILLIHFLVGIIATRIIHPEKMSRENLMLGILFMPPVVLMMTFFVLISSPAMLSVSFWN